MNPFMCMQSAIVTSLYLQSLIYIPLVILIFTIFSYFFFEIYYRTKAIVCQYILKSPIQCPAVILL
jgi:hypothetical protein